jgi:molybdopterin/thiamine biosynthesis adenylyltransferase
MATTFVPGQTGCFACLFPHEPVKTKEARLPALGPAAGVIASIQSMEALRILLGLPPKLAGKLLEFSGTEMRFRTVGLEKNPECEVCAHIEGE